jgi:alkaline phosphatase
VEGRAVLHTAGATPHAQAVILFIGDGMGTEHLEAGRWAAVGQRGQLAMDTLPVSGMLRTASENSTRINPTDSAAAATALATGVKTKNGYIGVDEDGAALETILEIAEGQGMATGLVTTAQVTDATPAAFAAHVSDRYRMQEVALQMLESGVDVLLGGGENDFLPRSIDGKYPSPGNRTDRKNLILNNLGIPGGFDEWVWDAAGLAAVNPAADRLIGLFADEVMPRPYSPTLAQMTEAAIGILSRDPEGFFLMVEGGGIDRAAHDRDARNVIGDVTGFDEAVQVGLEYAALHPDTLVIVAADHETGGLTASPSSGKRGSFHMPDGTPFNVSFSTSIHTNRDVPVTAAGPGAPGLEGTHDLTAVFAAMHRAITGTTSD